MADNNNQGPDFDPNDGRYQSPEDQFAKEPAAPAVASPPGRSLAFLALFVGGAMIIIYLIFFSGGEEEPKPSDVKPPNPIVTPINENIYVPPPPIQTPPPLEDEPIDEVETDPTASTDFTKNPDQRKRIQSNLLVTQNGIFGGTTFGGSGSGDPQDPNNNGVAFDNDPNLSWADTFYNQKNVPNAYARKLGDTNKIITQGKIIESVLETPINSDVPGMIRAVVSRDIYAESGRAILIPKGSRLVGTYNSFVLRGNKRISIIWSRVIRPDGIDIMLRSGGTDQLGRAGVEGIVDNKYMEIFSSAFLVSAINIAVGMGVDSIQDDQIRETQNTDGSTTRTSTAGQEATMRAVDLFGDAAENLIQNFINTKPTITIDQGTRVSVFVNRDLVFPSSLTNDVTIIQ